LWRLFASSKKAGIAATIKNGRGKKMVNLLYGDREVSVQSKTNKPFFSIEPAFFPN
jgi:hypothetical protein